MLELEVRVMFTARLLSRVAIFSLIGLGATTVSSAQQAAVASATNKIVATQLSQGATTTAWSTILKTTFDTSDFGGRPIIIETSTITALFSGDVSLSTGTLFLENAGIQARVLIDCNWPCKSASDQVPTANLATPGVITLDQAFHFLLHLDTGSFNVAVNGTAGAHSFNFFKLNLPDMKHVVEFQVRFMVDTATYSNGLSLNGVLAGVGPRTMVVDALDIDLDQGQ
jgi:hypothetical protein